MIEDDDDQQAAPVAIPSHPDMPTSSDYEPWQVEPPVEQKASDAKEHEELVSDVKVVGEIMDWLQQNIDIYHGTSHIDGIHPGTKAEDLKSAVLLSKGMHVEFTDKLRDFRERFGEYVRKPAE